MIKEILLFILLSPGFLITIPPAGKSKTSYISIFVHALIFGLVLYYSKYIPGIDQIEPFAEPCYNKMDNDSAMIGGIMLGAVGTLVLRYIFEAMNKPAVQLPYESRQYAPYR